MIFLNGRILAPDQARIDPADRGFLLGDGLFETLRCRAGRPLALARHHARLAAGAKVLGIPYDKSEAALRDDIETLLAANDIARTDAALRITLTRGPGPRGILPPDDPEPTLMMTAVAMTPSPKPARAGLATIRRNEHSPLSRLKTLAYLDGILARREASAAGADEAILLNTTGRLACASVANLFLVRARRLLTPPLSEGVLPGITRAQVMELAPRLDLTISEVPLERSQLTSCDEAFLTNSLAGVRPLSAIDGRAIGDGRPGPVTERLGAAFEELNE